MGQRVQQGFSGCNRGFHSRCPSCGPDITCTALHETQPSKRVENPADRAVTQKIRKAIQEDSTLSTYAHNIKIITQDGKVTLRGPVWSEDDKSNIEAKAVAVAGCDNAVSSRFRRGRFPRCWCDSCPL